MELKGSQTATNLMAAFAGESQARNRYTAYAGKARGEGYVQISSIFEETADQEKEHAKRLFKFMTGGETEITASFPFGIIDSTVENLKNSAAGPRSMYFMKDPQLPTDCRACTTCWPEHSKIFSRAIRPCAATMSSGAVDGIRMACQ